MTLDISSLALINSLSSQIEEYGDERSVRLTEAERLAVTARRISQLVPRNRQHSLALGALLPAYCKVFGHPVCLEDYGVHDLEALVRKFCHIVEVTQYFSNDFS